MSNPSNCDRPIPTVEERWNTWSLTETLKSSDGSDLLQLKSPASTFRTPSLTASDEEEIEQWEQQAAQLNTTNRLSQQDSQCDWRSGEILSRDTNKGNYPELFSKFGGQRKIVKATAIRRKMVVEREPPKSATSLPGKQNQSALERQNLEEELACQANSSLRNPNQPVLSNIQHPEFGKVSPLQNRLQSSVFNIPKRQQPRVEHHRPTQGGYSNHRGSGHAPIYGDTYRSQSAQTKHEVKIPSNSDCFEVPRPANHPTWSSYSRPAQPTFSSFVPATVDTSSRIGNFIDLASTVNQQNPESAIFDDRFGAPDPYDYIDAGKATENIKALLEGAFDDEDDDQPRTRSRKKKAEAAISGLVTKLQSSGVGNEQKQGIRNEEDEEEEDDDGVIEGLQIKLLPHQVEGVEWMRDKEGRVKKKNGVLPKGGILADDMGLGKTIQSISLILTNPRPPPSSNGDNNKTLPKSVEKGTLVVAPLALIKQWEAEIKNRLLDSHKLRVCVHHGPQRTKRFEDLRKYDVVITTYQILVSEHGNSSPDGPQVGCFGLHWYRVILDEAHTIKNRNAKATKACCALRAEYRWCLTGTPMQNNLDELQSLINFLRIKPYNELPVWKDQITRPMANGRGGVAIKRLQFYLKAFMKRRTKDVLKQEGALNPGGKKTTEGSIDNGFKITERKIENISAEFSAAERKFYDRLEKRADKSLERMMGGQKLNYASALVLLLRLRQACNHPQLVGGSMAQDNDALTVGQGLGSQTSRKPKAVDKDLDDVADLLGGLSVKTKQCDVCQVDLHKDEIAAGSIRCTECEEDIAEQLNSSKRERSKKHKQQKSPSVAAEKVQAKRKPNRPTLIDSSDEDEVEGEWLVPRGQRISQDSGNAGGTDDENAEGDGESLGAEDSDTEDEDVIPARNQRKKIISLSSDDEDTVPASEQQRKVVSPGSFVVVEDGSRSAEVDSDPEMESDEESTSSSRSSRKPSPTESAKIKHLIKILQRESAEHKFIVFSQFTSMLNLIEPFLHEHRLFFTRYDGSMRNDHREASLERLRNDPKTRILLCSLKCGSLGLNLTAASRVVILEPFWNPFVEEQAIDRVHRLNQTIDVTVYKLTIANTVEERILALQDKKRALAEAAIEGKAVGKLSMKDILNLFRRDAETYDHEDVALGEKTRILSPVKDEGNLETITVRTGGIRLSPPVMEKGRAPPREEGIWGRRW